ncbi:hypothetical protein G6F58_013461 [Rhizopus delemar]|nr:hypothetical protein G6F58_013461 [Rhizopus delemar]
MVVKRCGSTLRASLTCSNAAGARCRTGAGAVRRRAADPRADPARPAGAAGPPGGAGRRGRRSHRLRPRAARCRGQGRLDRRAEGCH